MSGWGFRLYWIEARPTTKRNKLPLAGSELVPEASFSEFVASLRAAKDSGLFAGEPSYPRASQPEADLSVTEVPNADDGSDEDRRLPHIVIEDVVAFARRVDVVVRYGREGDADIATDREGGRISMKGLAGTKKFRVSIYWPEEGPYAGVVGETRGRTHVVARLCQLISVQNARRAAAKYEADPAASDSDEIAWVKWWPTAITDPERVAEVIDKGQQISVRLRRGSALAKGGRGSGELELTQSGIALEKKQLLTKVVLGWLAKKSGKAVGSDERFKLEQVLDDDVSGLGFDDGEVKIDEKGKPQTITPQTVDQIYFYPLSKQLPDNALRKEGVHRLAGLARREKLTLEFGLDLEED